MPRPEDIAWKFVIRLEGKRWRCPYCHKGSTGSVTRVKSHFLKQTNGGIAICPKVPEHIRTLMELLLNHEVHNKENIAWKFVNRVEDNKWRCRYCSVEFSGDLTGVKGHLLGVPNEGISICTGVPEHIRTLMRSLLDEDIEEAEEESREVAEEQSREAHGQSSMEPESHDTLPPADMDMIVQSIYANNEEIRNLKRKVEELNDNEAVIKKQMEIESAASSVWKKQRILVEICLKETERVRNNFQIIGQANAETLPAKEQVETLTREVEDPIEQMTLLIEARDAKGVAFSERKLRGEAIHKKIESIWDRLNKNHACKLGIYGMGGVGKTSIMMHIHNRLLKDATFDGVVFITVSRDFSIYKLQSYIWKALKSAVMEDEHEKKRATMLLEQLKRKKNCVLIFDDVWECFDLEEVGIPVGADGLKLVLTTRSFEVCCRMHCQEKIYIGTLSEKEAESLFLEELRSKVASNVEIEEVLKSIVKKCAGLPIGVITMARSMGGVTNVFEWRDTLVKLKELNMGQTVMEKVLMNLKFSYDYLSDPIVQQCFLSCALYPKDKWIDDFELVELFIDQGLIDKLSTRKEQYDRGLTILEKLTNVCLLEASCDKRKRKMHDLIRDMALHIMNVTSIVKAGGELRKIPPEEYWTDALEKVSLMDNCFIEFPLNMSPNCPKLSTLLLNGCLSGNVAIPDSFFKNLLGLKVLNLSGNDIAELPNSILDLVNLRALLLKKCTKLCRIPYLGKLTSLRKLDASGCQSLEALEGLEKLVNLRYLDLTMTRIERLPKGTLDCLLHLQFLNVGAVNEEDITKLGALETFRCFPENADDVNRYVRVINQSNNRPSYILRVDLEVSEFMVEVGDYARLENLYRSVFIRGWSHAIVSMEGKCSGNFILIPQYVQVFGGTKCDGITNLSGMGPLEYLEELVIDGWENLGVLYGEQDDEVINICDFLAPTPTPLLFPNLGFLEISECPKLKYLFGHGFKSNLPQLRAIQIFRCEEMVGIIAAVISPPAHPLLAFPSLEMIFISECDKMKRVVESEWMPHFPNLREIQIYVCKNMEEIIGGPPLHVPVGEIVNNTPSSFQLPISLRNLERLKLCDLPQLKSICKVPLQCDFMKKLGVYKCPELKGIPFQLQLRDIEDLPHIWVEDEEKWKTLIWDHPNPQTILQPYLRKGRHADIDSPFLWEEWRSPNAIELSAKGNDVMWL